MRHPHISGTSRRIARNVDVRLHTAVHDKHVPYNVGCFVVCRVLCKDTRPEVLCILESRGW